MNSAKRSRTDSGDVDTDANSKDYLACDPCRVKKIRCGRERPCCANCARLGQQCGWSRQGKKPSQTATLNETVGRIDNRLDHMQKVLYEVHKSLARLQANGCVGQSSGTISPIFTQLVTPASGPALASVASSPREGPRLGLAPDLKRPGLRHVFPSGTGRAEQYHGPTSLQSLILDMGEFCLDPIRLGQGRRQVSEAAAEALGRLDRLNGIGEDLDAVLLNDVDSPPELPPLAIVEAMVEPYFSSLNKYVPIWTRSGFEGLLRTCHESGENEMLHHLASVVCFNSVVVLILTAKALAFKTRRHSQTQQPAAARNRKASSSSSMQAQLLRTFLANSKLALNRVKQLSRPSLLNVQALLSLCLVAQQYLDADTPRLIFHQAAYVAQSIGLHREPLPSSPESLSPDEDQERLGVLESLCIIGSSTGWVCGFGAGLCLNETIKSTLAQLERANPEVTVPTTTKSKFSSPVEVDRLRGLVLAQIQVEVISFLFGPTSSPRWSSEAHSAVSGLQQVLEQWHNRHRKPREEEPQGLAEVDAHVSSAECSIIFYTMKILLAWSTPQETQGSAAAALGDSRKCLQILQDAWKIASTVGHFVQLARLLVSYPPASFVHLSMHLINTINSSESYGTAESESVEKDFQLLNNFKSVVSTVAELCDSRLSYATKLEAFVQVILEFLGTLKHLGPQERSSVGLTISGEALACPPGQFRVLEATKALDGTADSHRSAPSLGRAVIPCSGEMMMDEIGKGDGSFGLHHPDIEMQLTDIPLDFHLNDMINGPPLEPWKDDDNQEPSFRF